MRIIMLLSRLVICLPNLKYVLCYLLAVSLYLWTWLNLPNVTLGID
jgi:hypothetical protein